MMQLFWMRYFLEDQGYRVGASKIYQDNMSTMSLKKNWKYSSVKRTRHINIRYFFIKERVNEEELIIDHCTNDEIWGDFFTKPLQVSKFRRFRSVSFGNSRADELSPLSNMLDSKVRIVDDNMGRLVNMEGGAHVCM